MYQAFVTIAVSIFLEGLFFLLIGVIIASAIDVLIPEETIRKFIPNNKFLALLGASTLGLIFPICECGIVPVIHRLLKKGVPLHLCVALLFSSPIVNIVVIVSTYFAFQDHLVIVIMRVTGGFIISFITGFTIATSFKKEEVLNMAALETKHISCACSHNIKHLQYDSYRNIISSNDSVFHKNDKIIIKIKEIISHAIDEFFDTAMYFIFGILVASIIQTIVPDQYFTNFGYNFPFSNLFMIFLPYVLSICSNTDAFIARSFLNQFNVSSLLCFMIFGAMFDIKTTIIPHIWMSPILVKIQTETIFNALLENDPDGKEIYTNGYNSFIEDLNLVHNELRKVLEPLKGNILFVFHPAFGYFADEFGFRQVAIETGGKEPGPAMLEKIIMQARENNVKVIFVQPEFSQKSAQVIARAIDGAVVMLNPLDPDYINNLRHIALEVKKAFN